MGGKKKGASLFKNPLPFLLCSEFRLSHFAEPRANSSTVHMALLHSLGLKQSPKCNPTPRYLTLADYKFFKDQKSCRLTSVPTGTVSVKGFMPSLKLPAAACKCKHMCEWNSLLEWCTFNGTACNTINGRSKVVTRREWHSS